jgi:hypothetical protein
LPPKRSSGLVCFATDAREIRAIMARQGLIRHHPVMRKVDWLPPRWSCPRDAANGAIELKSR